MTVADQPWEHRLDRVAEYVRAIARGEPGATDDPHALAAATALGWISTDGKPTGAGSAMAQCTDVAARMVYAALAFEGSAIGRGWLEYAGVPSLRDLTLQSADAFVKDSLRLGGADTARCAATMRYWLVAMQAAVEPHSDLAITLRAGGIEDSEIVTLVGALAARCDDAVSARMASWTRRHSVDYLHELALEDPQELERARTLGPDHVSATDAVFRTRTGRTWQELRRLLRPSPVALAGRASAGALRCAPDGEATWDAFRVAFPSRLRRLALRRLDLPARMRHLCERCRFETVGELLALSETELRSHGNMGKVTPRATVAKLRGLLDELAVSCGRNAVKAPTSALFARALGRYPDWIALMHARLGDLDANERLVLVRRSGLDHAPETLSQLGEQLGVSAERIRQLESQALGRLARDWWPLAFSERLLAALSDGARDLEELAEDSFFAGAAAHAVAFDYVLEWLLEAPARVLMIAGRAVVARTSPAAFAAAMAAARNELTRMAFPAPERELIRLVERNLRALGAGVEQFALAELRSDVAIADVAGRSMVLGRGRHAEIRAFLNASPAPVRAHHLKRRFGSSGWPEDLIYVDWGLVGLPSHVPDFDKWTQRLVPACMRAMAKRGRARHWSTSELLEIVRACMKVPEWLGPWHLVSMIRLDGRIRCLGRLRVTLQDGSGSIARTTISDRLAELLRASGAPMSRALLFDALRTHTGCSEPTFAGAVVNRPLLQVDGERVGLFERDLPGGLEAIAPAVTAIVAELERRGTGLFPTEACAIVRVLGAAHATWTTEIIRAVARQSGRCRVNHSGSIGLAAWSTVRLPTRRETVRELLAAGGGRVPAAEVVRVLEARFGRAVVQGAYLRSLARKAGALLLGSELVMVELTSEVAALQTARG